METLFNNADQLSKTTLILFSSGNPDLEHKLFLLRGRDDHIAGGNVNPVSLPDKV
jgi:hypothetical protein